MATSSRQKNGNWTFPSNGGSVDQANLQVQCDIRDALIEQNNLLRSLVRGALDTIVEVGRELRRKERARRAKRRVAKR